MEIADEQVRRTFQLPGLVWTKFRTAQAWLNLITTQPYTALLYPECQSSYLIPPVISTFQIGSALCYRQALQVGRYVPQIFLLVFPTPALEIVENEIRGKHLFRVVQTLR